MQQIVRDDGAARPTDPPTAPSSESKLHIFRTLVEHALDAVLLTSPDGSILLANPAACDLFGRDERTLCSIGRLGVVDASDERLPLALGERERTGSFRGELTFIRATGERFPAEVW